MIPASDGCFNPDVALRYHRLHRFIHRRLHRPSTGFGEEFRLHDLLELPDLVPNFPKAAISFSEVDISARELTKG